MAGFEEVKPSTVEEWNSVLHWVYTQSAPREPAAPPSKGEKRFLVREGGRVVSACRVRDYTVARGPVPVRCGGVAAVATLIEDRRSSHGADLMAGLLGAMRENGQPLSALYAFKNAYYARFGYGLSGYQWQIKSPSHRLPRRASGMEVARLDPKDWKKLQGCYAEFAATRSGNLVRRTEEWALRLAPANGAIYALGNPVRAYAVVKFDGFWGTAEASEAVYADAEGHDALINLFHSMVSNQEAIRWNEPPDSRFLSHFMEQGMEARRHGMTMFRLVDVPAALRLLQPEGKGTFTLHVDDAHARWNCGPWTVGWDNGRVEVAASNDAGLSLSVATLSQAYMGSPSFSQLVSDGFVQIKVRRDAEAAARFFGSLPVSMLDTF
ncbi:MAG: GNAT family N-acetyltransferase [Fimbriimonadaceae bacterium]|nr:GNAT family N-acetyltransferase [Fimbriimonadaceae bacterium]